jgi:hypothetical protein
MTAECARWLKINGRLMRKAASCEKLRRPSPDARSPLRDSKKRHAYSLRMRAILFISVVVGVVWTIDTYSLKGRVMQSAKTNAAYLQKQTEYEIWKLRYYYGR